MKRIAALALCLGVVLTGAGAGGSSVSTATKRPTLKLMRAAPLQVKATGFRSDERVRVVAVVQKRTTRRVTADDEGAFSLRFPGVSIDRCAGFTIFAIGARGSRAHLTRPNAYCPPPL